MEEPKETDKETYVVSIEDLFKVEADSIEAAEQKLLDRLGEGDYVAYNAKVIEKFD